MPLPFRFVTVVSTLAVGVALDNGLARTPPMGWNSWMAIGWSIDENYVHLVADYLNTSGLQKAGYVYVNSDDGWSAHRGPDGKIVPDPARWPHGLRNVSDWLHSQGFKFGLYTAESSIACSGRPGSLFFENVDAASFINDWAIDFIKVDNCAQYAYGNSRFFAMADAANRTGPLVISTEPFSLVPTPIQGEFSHMYRTTNDVEGSYSSNLNRLDLNANWWRLVGPGRWADPDCIMCGHFGNTSIAEAQCRSVFAVFAVTKSPLILGAQIWNFTAETLATVSNAGLIAVNQDPLGLPARKLAAENGQISPFFVGLAPCTTSNTVPGVNGVTAADLIWSLRPITPSDSIANGSVTILHTASGRCLSARTYLKLKTQVPVLLPCDVSDETQVWIVPQALTVTHIINAAMNLSLAVGTSTVWGTRHQEDNNTLLDAAYGITNMTFEPTIFEPPCSDRGCDGYEPRQSWYWSPVTGRLSLSLFSANMYHCYEGSAGCYQFSSDHPTATDDFCLSRVLAISNDGIDTFASGVHAWGGPLSGGAYVIALENRAGSTEPAASARWSWLEIPGVNDTTTFCVQELYSDKELGSYTGGITVSLPAYDAVVFRLVPGSC